MGAALAFQSLNFIFMSFMSFIISKLFLKTITNSGTKIYIELWKKCEANFTI